MLSEQHFYVSNILWLWLGLRFDVLTPAGLSVEQFVPPLSRYLEGALYKF